MIFLGSHGKKSYLGRSIVDARSIVHPDFEKRERPAPQNGRPGLYIDLGRLTMCYVSIAFGGVRIIAVCFLSDDRIVQYF